MCVVYIDISKNDSSPSFLILFQHLPPPHLQIHRIDISSDISIKSKDFLHEALDMIHTYMHKQTHTLSPFALSDTSNRERLRLPQ